MLLNWSGVGGDDTVPCTCTHVECYATGLGWGGMITFLALVHMLNATQLVWGGGGDDNFPCTCTHAESPVARPKRFLRTHCFFKEHSERSESSLENICLCLHVPATCGQCMA